MAAGDYGYDLAGRLVATAYFGREDVDSGLTHYFFNGTTGALLDTDDDGIPNLAEAARAASGIETYAEDANSLVGYDFQLSLSQYDSAGRAYRSIDALGRVYQTQRYQVVASTGAATNYFKTDYYYDRNNRQVAVAPAYQVATETAYDAAGRAYQTRVVTALSSTPYSSGAFNYRTPLPKPDLSSMDGGDQGVIQLTHAALDAAGNATEQHVFERHWYEATDGINLTNNNDYIRSSVFHWYDAAGRLTDTASHGCGNTSTDEWKYATRPTRDSSPPTASTATVLLTHYAYNPDTGLLELVTDPKGTKTGTFHDDLGRKTYVAENWWNFYPDTGGSGTGSTDKSQDKVTQFVYNGLGQLKQLVALDRNGDGTTDDNETTTYLYADTYDASLVTKTTYPDGGDVDVTYNLDGLVATRTDQREVTLTYTYDSQRRLSVQGATTVPSGVDTSILSIKREYDAIGRLEKVTSYSAANGSGTVRNQVQFAYDDLDRKTAIYQSHEGEVNTSTTPKTQIAYDDSTASNVFNDGGRLDYYTYPDGATQIAYYPGSLDVDDRLNRVRYVKQNSVTKAQYYYAGLGRLVAANYSEPVLYLYYLSTSANVYSGYDRFGRIRDQWWRDTGSSTTAAEIGHGYDYAGNRTYREDVAASAASVDLDELYIYDTAHRLLVMGRGNLASGNGSLATTNAAEVWTLDALGNWSTFYHDSDGQNLWEMTQTRAHNAANEITAIDSSDANVAHDAAGNMTKVPGLVADSPDHEHLIYDAWNRAVVIWNNVESYRLSEIEYNGLNERIVKTASIEGDEEVETRHFYYNDRWQCVEERRENTDGAIESYPVFRYVWGPRYIDELIYRDQCNPSTGSLVQRLYAMQDANWNVVALAEDDGDVVERFIYDAYGRATVLDPAFTADADNASDYAWTHLYTGRQLDLETGLMDYRNRCYHTALGRFVTRDPVGYGTGNNNLYSYCSEQPIQGIDPLGLVHKDRRYYELLNMLKDPNAEIRTNALLALLQQYYGLPPEAPFPEELLDDITQLSTGYITAFAQLSALCTSANLANTECSVEQCKKEAAAIALAYAKMFSLLQRDNPWRPPFIRNDYHCGWKCYQWQTHTYNTLKDLISKSKCFYMERVGLVISNELAHNWVTVTVGPTPPSPTQAVISGPATAWLDPWMGQGPCVYTLLPNGTYNHTPPNFVVMPQLDDPGDSVGVNTAQPSGSVGIYYPPTGGREWKCYKGWKW